MPPTSQLILIAPVFMIVPAVSASMLHQGLKVLSTVQPRLTSETISTSSEAMSDPLAPTPADLTRQKEDRSLPVGPLASPSDIRVLHLPITSLHRPSSAKILITLRSCLRCILSARCRNPRNPTSYTEIATKRPRQKRATDCR